MYSYDSLPDFVRSNIPDLNSYMPGYIVKISWHHINMKHVSEHKGGHVINSYDDLIIEKGDYPELDWFLDNGLEFLEDVYVEF